MLRRIEHAARYTGAATLCVEPLGPLILSTASKLAIERPSTVHTYLQNLHFFKSRLRAPIYKTSTLERVTDGREERAKAGEGREGERKGWEGRGGRGQGGQGEEVEKVHEIDGEHDWKTAIWGFAERLPGRQKATA